jgi:hypothetical protein
MKVNPGDHIVGMQYQGITFAWEDVTVLVHAEPKRSSYFRRLGAALPAVLCATTRRS